MRLRETLQRRGERLHTLRTLGDLLFQRRSSRGFRSFERVRERFPLRAETLLAACCFRILLRERGRPLRFGRFRLGLRFFRFFLGSGSTSFSFYLASF